MKVLTTAGLTKLIQLCKSAFVDKTDVVETQTVTLATVATSGSYNDLSNKPTIPTVNNATLTIQKNGTTVKTFTANASSNVTANITVPTNNNQLTNGAGYITSSALSGYATQTWVGQQGFLTSSSLSGYATETWVGQQGYLTSSALSGYATETWVGNQGYITGINSSDVTTALGYTPYDASNPDGYITGITSAMVTTALGYTPYNSSNPSGYISGITSAMVTTALGYTPYDSSNPNGYTSNTGTVTSVNNVSPVSGNVTLSIPTVNNSTITITQGGVTKGSFTLNQSTGDTIALDAGGGSVSIDDKSITENSSNELQTVGVIDQNNTSNAIKTWTGTKAQYDTLVNNSSVDSNTLYNITDDVNQIQVLLETIYPVGSLYFGTMDTCPLAALFGTWAKVGSKVVTNVATYLPVCGNGGALGITDGTNNYGLISTQYTASQQLYQGRSASAYDADVGTTGFGNGDSISTGTALGITENSAKSGIVADTTGRISTITTNIWQRTA